MISKKNNVLIIPGLNQSGDIFNFLSNLDHINYTVFKFPECFNISILDYHQKLQKHLESHNYDSIYCHSLGGLVFLDYFINNMEFVGDVHLISLPLFPRAMSKLVSFLPAGLMIPSFNRKKWRVRNYCTAGQYQEIYILQKRVLAKLFAKTIHKCPMLKVVYDPRDELISVDKLKVFTHCTQHFSKSFPRHLCLDYIYEDLRHKN